MLDIFNTDAFSTVSLTAAIEKVPYQPGRIGAQSAPADQYRVGTRPHGMDMRAGGGSGNPAAFARCQRDPAVERCRQLQRDMRPGLAGAQQVSGQRIARSGMIEHGTGNTGRLQPGDAVAGRARIGVDTTDHHARRTCRDHQIGTSRPARAVMRARFERDVKRGSCRGSAGLGQRPGFGMGTSAGAGKSAPHHPAIANHNRADRRIGAAERACACGQRRCGLHPGVVAGHCCRAQGMPDGGASGSTIGLTPFCK